MGIFKRNKNKSKAALWKRILKWTGIGFLLLLIFIILAPFLFKPQIVGYIKSEINNNINKEVATIDFDDVSLEFISTFPKFTLTLEGLHVKGQGDFEGVDLADIKELEARLDLWSVVGGGKYEVESVKLIEPKLHVKVLEDGRTNYDIALPDTAKPEPEEESKFEFKLKDYEVVNGEFIYDDAYYVTYVELNKLNHKGELGITDAVYNLSTHSTIEQLTLIYDDVAYINKAKTVADANMVIDMTTDLALHFKDNHIDMNNLKLHADGGFMMDDIGYKFDKLSLSADESEFKDFLSMIPTPYAVDMSDIVATGQFGLSGMVDGYYSDNSMPGFDLLFKISDGYIQYPDMPANISGLNIDANVKREEGADLDNTIIALDKIQANLAGNTINSKVHVTNPMTDPNIDAVIKAYMDLAKLSTVIPMADGESYSGIINSDVALRGRMSAIEQERYEDFHAAGKMLISALNYKSPDLQDPVLIDTLDLRFSPKQVELAGFTTRIGENDFRANGHIDNYLGYVFRDELLKGEFNLYSNNLNADYFMAESEESSEETSAEVSEEESSMGVIPVPDNLDFKLHTSLKRVLYDGIELSNVSGDIHVKDGVADLKNLSLNVFGGEVVMNGLYDTRNSDKPHMGMGYSLRSIDIASIASSFESIEKLAPIAKYCQGKISSDFNFNGDLSQTMEPLYNSLSGGGFVKSSKIEVQDFEPVTKMSSALKMPELAKQTVQNVYTKFEFKDGKVFVEPFDVKLDGMAANIEGSTSFEQDLDYKIKLEVPKEKLPKEAIEAAEKMMSGASNLGIQMNALPNKIPVNVLMGGKVQDPTITTDLKEQLLALSGNMTDQIKDKIKEEIDDKIEDVKEEIEDKVEDVKDDLKERRDKIMADAQKEADRVKAEAKSAADKIRAEADKQYEETVGQASNAIERKALEKSAGYAREQAYKKADKLEQEAAAKADRIMSEAETKANSLE